jgi:hypothetical protein
MKLIPKTLFAALAVTLLTSGSLFAADAVRRIDHPNGPATYVTAPGEGRGFLSPESRGGTTIGVYAGERSFGRRDREARYEVGLNDSEGRTMVPLHRGRGQTLYIPVER